MYSNYELHYSLQIGQTLYALRENVTSILVIIRRNFDAFSVWQLITRECIQS